MISRGFEPSHLPTKNISPGNNHYSCQNLLIPTWPSVDWETAYALIDQVSTGTGRRYNITCKTPPGLSKVFKHDFVPNSSANKLVQARSGCRSAECQLTR